MPRLNLTQKPQGPSEMQSRYARVTEGEQGLADTYRALFSNPQVACRLAGLDELIGQSAEPWINYTVALTVAHERNSATLWSSFEPVARKAGVSNAVIEGIASGTAPRGLLPKEGIWVHFTLEMIRDQVRDSTWQAATHLVGESGAVNLAITACYYETMARLNSAFALDAG